MGSLLALDRGVLLFEESLPLSKLLFFALIMTDVVGMSFAPYLDAAGENALARLTRMLDGKVPRFGNYLIWFPVLSFLVMGNSTEASSQIEECRVMFGSLVAIVLGLVLILFLVLLQSGVPLSSALLASAALWLVLMFVMVPRRCDS